MPRLEWSHEALHGLDRLVPTHGLPVDTRARVEESARSLARFPRLGPEIRKLEPGSELRFVIGPWPWLVIVYLYVGSDDRVVVVAFEDGRAASATLTPSK